MKFLAVVLAVFSFGYISAQEYAFKVLINKGENTVKSGNDWILIKVGSSLDSLDEVKVSRNGYLGLVHHSGYPVEVKKAGLHKVGELAKTVKGGSSVLNKYTDFILSAQPDVESNLTATGSVYRGGGAIEVFLPRAQQAIIFNDEVSISWVAEPDTRIYVVQLNSMFGDELDSFTARDTTVLINLAAPELAEEDNIVVKVFSKNDKQIASNDFVLKKLSLADKKRITSALSEISSVTAEKNALNLLYLAAFYEENGLLIDALTAYQQAVTLAPEVPYYTHAYQEFILRNALKN